MGLHCHESFLSAKRVFVFFFFFFRFSFNLFGAHEWEYIGSSLCFNLSFCHLLFYTFFSSSANAQDIYIFFYYIIGLFYTRRDIKGKACCAYFSSFLFFLYLASGLLHSSRRGNMTRTTYELQHLIYIFF